LIPPDADVDEDQDPTEDVDSDTDEDEDDLDDAPPVDEDDEEDDQDENEDEEDDDDAVDLNEFEARILDQVQRRFDRAVSRISRNLQSANTDADDDDEDDDDEDDEPKGKSKKRRQRTARRQVDPSAIRLLARDRIADEMEKAGSAERKAVKAIVDKVVPHIDWESVGDQDEFVEDLVQTLKGTADNLVRTGSDRKVNQLRRLGKIPPKSTQPGSKGNSGSGKTPTQQMKKGAAVAKARWPEGKRRLTR